MRRRLLLVILGTTALAILIATASSFALLSQRTAAETKKTLRQQANRFKDSRLNNPRDYQGVRQLLDVDGLARVMFRDPTIAGTPSRQLTGADVDVTDGIDVPAAVLERMGPEQMRRLVAGAVFTGQVGRTAWAIGGEEPRGPNAAAVILQQRIPSTVGAALSRLLLGSALSLVLAGVVAAVLARRLSQPIRETTAAYARIAGGDLSVRVAERNATRRRDDEIGELMRNLDVMAESLDRAQRQERQFLLSVSHDLRTPLTSIRGFSEALADGAAPDPQRAGEVIASEARRLERLVKDLLDLAKLEARQFKLDLRRTDMTELVTDAADGFLPTAEREHLRLSLAAEEGLWAVVDRDRMAQVMANLIENACKYARKVVTVSAVAGEGGAVAVRIADDGPGIAAEDLPLVFDRHYTSDRRASRQIGSGLGLAIVRELVNAMGATILPITSPAGTTFELCLPGPGLIA